MLVKKGLMLLFKNFVSFMTVGFMSYLVIRNVIDESLMICTREPNLPTKGQPGWSAIGRSSKTSRVRIPEAHFLVGEDFIAPEPVRSAYLT